MKSFGALQRWQPINNQMLKFHSDYCKQKLTGPYGAATESRLVLNTQCCIYYEINCSAHRRFPGHRITVK